MNSEPNSLYDRYKDRCNGSLFFVALVGVLGFFPAICFVALICQSLFPDYRNEVALVAIFLACLMLFMFCVKVSHPIRQLEVVSGAIHSYRLELQTPGS